MFILIAPLNALVPRRNIEIEKVSNRDPVVDDENALSLAAGNLMSYEPT